MALVKSRNGDLPSVRSMFTDMFDVDRFFERDPFFRGMSRQIPSVNITETDNSFEVEMAAPGLNKQDFKINLDNDVLTIWAEHTQEQKEEKKNYTRKEFNYESFERSFVLPATANTESIHAEYKDGILHLMIPKKEDSKRKSKEIRIE